MDNFTTINSDDYKVVFGDASEHLKQFISTNNYSKIFFITDTNVNEHCYPSLALNIAGDIQHDIIEFDAGEENKNIDICIGLWSMLMDFQADRNCLVVNFGGGVVTDMGSFVASTYKRGVDFIQVPTSLLAMVDASVGGKTGIDVGNAKNMVGTFSNPKLVIIDICFLETLPHREMMSGFAEMIKHGLITDKDYYELLRGFDSKNINAKLIYDSVMIKNVITTIDPNEKNARKKLNFGHTIGHAIESFALSNDDSLLHGEAVALGMISESWLSWKYAGLPKSELSDICNMILGYYPTTYHIPDDSLNDLLSYMKQDKKNEGNGINFTLLNGIGKSSINYVCLEDNIIDALSFCNKIQLMRDNKW